MVKEITSLPRFEWQTITGFRGFEFSLHEALPGGGTNLDGKQIFKFEFPASQRQFDLNSPDFASVKGLLKTGKHYVWTVAGIYHTTSGRQLKNSNIFKFIYSDGNSGSNESLDAILQTILKDNYESVKKEFDGMKFKSIKINDEDKTIPDFQRFINGLDLDGKIIIVETL